MAKHYSVLIEEPAYNDLRNILVHIARDSVTVAQKIHGELLEQMRSLESLPERHQVLVVVRGYEVRHLVFKKVFRILYTVRGNEVHILHCLRSEQDIANIF